MDFSLSYEQKSLIETVRRFVRERIVPLEDDLDPDASELDDETYQRLVEETKKMGLFNLGAPPDLGGPEVDTVTNSLLAIEMSQHRAGLYTPCYGTFGSAGGLAQLFGATEAQKEKYLYPTLAGEKSGFFALTEPSGGSDPGRSIRTRAVRDGDMWVLNGSKVFISGADTADYGLVFARTGTIESGRNGITCFIVDADTPGFAVRRVIHTLRSGHYATELQFDDARVPADNVLGGMNKGFSIANDVLSRQRVIYAAGCLGPAVKAHEMAVEYAPIRTVFQKTLAEHEGIQWMLVDNEIDLRTATMAVLHAADLADRGQPFRTEAAIAKMLASEAAGRVVDRCIQIHGGYGVTKELPLERWYRELRIRRIGEGTTETQRMVISRDVLAGRHRPMFR
jgi:acyl-CoA dehydrogenase